MRTQTRQFQRSVRWMIAGLWPLAMLGLVITGGKAQESGPPVVDDRRMPTGQTIAPAGEIASFFGRPVDLAIGPDRKRLFVKDRSALRIIDIESMELVETIELPGGASLYGIAVSTQGDVWLTNAGNGLCRFAAGADGGYELRQTIALGEASFPCGLTLSTDQKTAYVCLSKSNSVAVVDLEAGQLTNTIEVGVAPFDCRIDESGYLLVSNIGGRRATDGDRTAPSAGTEVVVDQRGIANNGTVSVVDRKAGQVVRTIASGRHPSVLAAAGEAPQSVVCLTNEDAVAVLDPDLETIRSTVVVKPEGELPFGSMPSAILPWPDRDWHFVALAGNNAVAVVDLNRPQQPVVGLVPTAWYPVGLAVDADHLFVACVKGVGSRSIRRDLAKGRNSHDHQGTVQKIPLRQIADAEQLQRWTEVAIDSSKLSRIRRDIRTPAESGEETPVPIPEQLGQPSVFRHVIYVIKENRTFDQVFGDFEEARSEPELCVFPEKVTPNHHALARRFGILDNYYCNGVLSADGHSWATEGNVTPYLERAFGGFARSYTFGDDPITYSSSGFLWDHVLDAGLSFRNYGELDYAKPPAGMKYQEIWKAYESGQPISFSQQIGIERLRRYSCREYPGWNMLIPDVLRMDRFLKEFREFEDNGQLPSLSIVYLPQDHLGGGITSRSHMADNDLAVGRLVEAVSQSRYWKETVIFINEDDPQNGYDHIDGHRSLCLVVSPYSRPGVNHDFYNQTSVLRTILHIFGLPPMNQQDAASPLMRSCFQPMPDLEPYEVREANYSLHESPEEERQQSAVERKWRAILATVPIERTGMKTERDEDHLNRFVWHEMKGWSTPYPTEWSGAHGRGLKALDLILDEAEDD